ncbi:oxidoreductase [Saccharothrix yanglingensis]|uniref:Oxidoreductase n=1 Tax=Saccharothrix yanglingensis TaxID=659496 RepID=A0ABU0WTY4_9PSEU|nr:oxidoreductase [Saccharothrix yanglingensis]MDQ2583316.1 oxidoreductase [Saccharothrix yanglingensis]
MTDPLAPLLDLPGVTAAVDSARDAVFQVHRHRVNLRGWATTAAEASVRAARASAALDGGATAIPEDGAVTDPVLAGALRVAEALGVVLPTWQRAPLQALARLHVLAGADLGGDLGRPRPAPGVAERLDLLAQLVTGGTSAPGPLVVAVVHGELMSLAPFDKANGVVARAASRLASIATGLDPKSLGVPEVMCLRRQNDYAAALHGFSTGDPEGIGRWIAFWCEALEAGAREARSIADAAAG